MDLTLAQLQLETPFFIVNLPSLYDKLNQELEGAFLLALLTRLVADE